MRKVTTWLRNYWIMNSPFGGHIDWTKVTLFFAGLVVFICLFAISCGLDPFAIFKIYNR